MRKHFLQKTLSALLAGAMITSMVPAFAASAASGSTIIPNDAGGIYNPNLYQNILTYHDENKDGKLSVSEAAGVTEIYIVGSRITSLKGIHNLPNLKSLTIQNCGLSSVHYDLGKLSKLEELNLSYNKISSISNNVTSGLKSLKKVDLSGNRIEKLYTGVRKWTKVTELDLSNNEFNYVPGNIGWMKAMEKLDLSGNNIVNNTDSTKKQLHFLKFFTNLKELDLSNNKLTSFPSATLKYLRNLEKLDLSNNKLSYILKEIGYLTKLKELDMSNNQVKSIASSYLNKCKNLEKLNLANNKLTNSKMPNLKYLPKLECTPTNDFAVNLCGNALSQSTIRKYTSSKLSDAWVKRQTTKTFVPTEKINATPAITDSGKTIDMKNYFTVNPTNTTYRNYKYEIVNKSDGITASLNGSKLTAEKMHPALPAGHVFVKVLTLDGSGIEEVIFVQIQ